MLHDMDFRCFTSLWGRMRDFCILKESSKAVFYAQLRLRKSQIVSTAWIRACRCCLVWSSISCLKRRFSSCFLSYSTLPVTVLLPPWFGPPVPRFPSLTRVFKSGCTWNRQTVCSVCSVAIWRLEGSGFSSTCKVTLLQHELELLLPESCFCCFGSVTFFFCSCFYHKICCLLVLLYCEHSLLGN